MESFDWLTASFGEKFKGQTAAKGRLARHFSLHVNFEQHVLIVNKVLSSAHQFSVFSLRVAIQAFFQRPDYISKAVFGVS